MPQPTPIGTFIHGTAIIGPKVIIGNNVYIGPLCIIGFPAEWRGHEDQDKGVVICDGARLTGLVTVDAGTERATVIGDNAYIMKHAHIGHDVFLSDGVTISCGAKIGGHARIGCYVNIGLNAVVHQKQDIAEGCMIGAQAMVTKRLVTEPYKTYAGNPAKLLGQNDKHPHYTIYQKQMYDAKDMHIDAGV